MDSFLGTTYQTHKKGSSTQTYNQFHYDLGPIPPINVISGLNKAMSGTAQKRDN